MLSISFIVRKNVGPENYEILKLLLKKPESHVFIRIEILSYLE